MDLKQFEDNLNKKFKDYEPVVDGMKIWDNIEDQIPKPKKKRRFAWFLILVPVLLLLGAYFTYDVKNAKDSAAIEKDSIYIVDQKNDSQTVQSTATNTGNEAVEKMDANENLKINKAQEITTVLVEQNSPAQVEELSLLTSGSLDLVQENPVNEISKETTNTKNQKDIPTSNNLVEVASNLQLGIDIETMKNPKTNNEPTKAKTEVVTSNAVNENASVFGSTTSEIKTEIVVEEVVEEEVSETVEPAIEKAEEIVEAAVETAENTIMETEVETTEESVVVPVMKDEEKDGQSITTSSEEKEMAVDSKEARSAKKKLSKKKLYDRSSLSTNFTIFGATRNFFDVADFQQPIIDKRNEVEKSLEAIQLGLEYKYYLTKRINVIGGLRAWQHTRSSDHEVHTTTEELLETVTEMNHLPDGSIENVYGEVNTLVTESYSATRYLRYQSLSALALLNYQLISGKNTSLDLGAGLEVGLLASQSGYELDTEMTEYLITEDEDMRYKKRSGDFLVFRVSTMTELTDHWKWSIGLETKYGLNGIQSEGLGFNQKFNFLGIQTGFNYTF